MATTNKKPKRKREQEWQKHGDPRCYEGHYRAKSNLSRWLRETHGWNQKKLAERIGTDESTVSKWLAGARYLSDENLVLIALETHVSLPFLLDLRKYDDKYATSSTAGFGPQLAMVRAKLSKRVECYEAYRELLRLENGSLPTVQVDEDEWMVDTSYIEACYPEPISIDIEFDEYGQPYESRLYYHEAVSVTLRDENEYRGDYRDPNHLLRAVIDEFVRRGWGPNTLNHVASLIP